MYPWCLAWHLGFLTHSDPNGLDETTAACAQTTCKGHEESGASSWVCGCETTVCGSKTSKTPEHCLFSCRSVWSLQDSKKSCFQTTFPTPVVPHGLWPGGGFEDRCAPFSAEMAKHARDGRKSLYKFNQRSFPVSFSNVVVESFGSALTLQQQIKQSADRVGAEVKLPTNPNHRAGELSFCNSTTSRAESRGAKERSRIESRSST